ncbi:MAG TPA: hypothetical protein VLL05_04060 [Terriglobales bacterium]|nr:hypothetical protein [Terriglobales bacterium]
MRHWIAKIIAAAAIAVVLLTAAGVAAVPMVRHAVSGWWNNPEGLPALPENPLVHYETGGSEYAQTVAALLPAAITRVEAAQGRAFAHPVPVGVYTTRDAFVAANGLGDPRAVGMTFLRRVMLSPVLFSSQRQRLPALLTHEMSHAHLQSWMSQLGYWRLPQWFKEGLAVMVSGGGGAEGVSESQARDAIRSGDHIALTTSNSLLNLGAIRYAKSPEIPATSFRTLMAYRQAGMFVTFLQDTNPAGFARMMDTILDDRSFAEAVTTGYGTDLQVLWLRFAQAQSTTH